MKPIYLASLLFTALGVSSASASLTTDTWNGANNNFNSGSNWSTGAAPTSANSAAFNGNSGYNLNPIVGSNITVGGLSLNTSIAYTIGTANGVTLTLDGQGTNTTSLGGGPGTETLTGTVVIQNTGGTSSTINAGAGALVFTSASNLTIKTNVSSTSNGGGSLAINGAFSYGSTGSTTTYSYNKGGSSASSTSVLDYNPSSATFSGTTTLADGVNSTDSPTNFNKIDIQTSIASGGLSNLIVGNSNAVKGAIYINKDGVSVGAPLSIGPSQTNITGGTYTFGMDSSSAAAGSVTSNVTLFNGSGSSGTDNFDVAANNTLTVSGAIADSVATTSAGFTVTKTSTGTLVLSSPTGNTYTNATQVNAGTVLLGNGSTGSATGTGALSVANGATLGGITTGTGRVGTSSTSSFAIGTIATGVANVIVGTGKDATSSLGLAAASSSSVDGTFTNANLNFNLDSASTNANLLALGNTNVSFATTTLTLNILNGSIIAPNTAYTLITDAAGFNSATDGLVITNGIITGGLSIAPNAFFGVENINGVTSGYYSGSYLFISADDKSIEVEVVPEPSTTAELLSGAILLLGFVLRRRWSTGRARA